jgi:hypothetical protein
MFCLFAVPRSTQKINLERFAQVRLSGDMNFLFAADISNIGPAAAGDALADTLGAMSLLTNRKGRTSFLAYTRTNGVGALAKALQAGLWIRIDLMRIRIQHFCSIRIRIQAKTELSKTIAF